MSAANYASFRNETPLVALALKGDQTLVGRIMDQARRNVGSGEPGAVQQEARRIAGSVSVRASSLARQQSLAGCYGSERAIAWVGGIGAAIALPMMIAQDAERAACLNEVNSIIVLVPNP
jgi:hypothetical protein